jgi:RES domain-containing protein
VVSESIEGGVVQPVAKRQGRSAEEKPRIMEATLVSGASIARVAREHGVNANQVFQCSPAGLFVPGGFPH